MRRYTLRIDSDIKLHKHPKWLKAWKKTRKAILESLGFKVSRIIVKPSRMDGSERGIHAWIYIESPRRLSDRDLCWIQFLCGDDPTRFKINLRRVSRRFKYWNKLFSRTVKVYKGRRISLKACRKIYRLLAEAGFFD